MSTPRMLTEVIDQMVAVIPTEEKRLLSDLAKVRTSCLFGAPEAMGYFWEECEDALKTSLGNRRQAWVAQVNAIFTGKVSSNVTSHTKGPWIATTRANVRAAPDAHGRMANLAICFHEREYQGVSFEEAVANAKLMAAAPDLLAACEATLTSLEEIEDADAVLVDLAKQVRAAVEKAKGPL